jgi:hypothetical protein
MACVEAKHGAIAGHPSDSRKYRPSAGSTDNLFLGASKPISVVSTWGR